MINDRATKKADELLPWETFSCETADEETWQQLVDGIAAELREAYAEIEQWKDRCRAGYDLCNQKDAEIARLRAELQHWREAAASVGQPDGHGWAEETKSLRAELEKMVEKLIQERANNIRLQIRAEDCGSPKHNFPRPEDQPMIDRSMNEEVLASRAINLWRAELARK